MLTWEHASRFQRHENRYGVRFSRSKMRGGIAKLQAVTLMSLAMGWPARAAQHSQRAMGFRHGAPPQNTPGNDHSCEGKPGKYLLASGKTLRKPHGAGAPDPVGQVTGMWNGNWGRSRRLFPNREAYTTYCRGCAPISTAAFDLPGFPP